MAELEKIEGIKIGRPQGAFYCVAELPIDNSVVAPRIGVEEFRVNGETVMVAPASGFYASEGLGRNQIRIAYVLDKESLKRAVAILNEALKTYKG